MLHFPVSASLLEAQAIAHYLHENYTFNKPLPCKLLKTWVNDTYLLGDGGQRFIFRIYTYQWRSRSAVEAELQLLQLLHANSVGVSYPIPDKRGGLIQELSAPEGIRFAVLFSYAPGEKKHDPDLATHYSIAVAMARMHQHTIGVQLNRVSYSDTELLDRALEKIAPHLSHDSGEWQWLQRAVQELQLQLTGVQMQSLRKGVVHLDIWSDNLHIDAAGKICFFDFDFCGNGWLALDLAFYIGQLSVMGVAPERLPEQKAAFLEGYESITVLSEAEKAVLPALSKALLIFYLGVQCQRFKSLFINEHYVKRFINLRIKKED